MNLPVRAIETTGVIDEKRQLRRAAGFVHIAPTSAVMTVATSIIQRELGELSPRMQAEVNAKLRDLFES
ncbi:MAG: hypothetical protein KAW49_12615 [Anaerolineae bacterium]|nr:hypothetical protein [Anaerolineae bacterium]